MSDRPTTRPPAPVRPSANVSLTPELRDYLDAQLASGDYANASEVVRAGLRALRAGPSTDTRRAPWPPAGGTCGALIRGKDWSAHPMGCSAEWPAVLRTTVANLVNSPVAKVLLWGPDHRMFYNDAYCPIIGARHPQILGEPVATAVPEVWDFNRPIMAAGLAGQTQALTDQPIEFIDPDGTHRVLYLHLYYTPVYGDDGRPAGVLCTIVDNSERVAAERAAALAHRRFATAVDAVHGVLWTNDAQGRMTGEQAAWGALTGQGRADYQDHGWSAAVHPDDAAATLAAWEAAVAARGPFVHEHRVRRHDGVWRTFAIRGLPVLDADGAIEEWVGVHTDITHRRAAEAALRDRADDLARQVRHRERAEDQLRQLNETLEHRVIDEIARRRDSEAKLAQAQKMETVGKLTGGVAHDFNNLLQVVGGNLQLLLKDVAGNDRAERRVANAMGGVQRGAKLAAQLLAFGRRQALEPKVVNVSRFVAGMDDMLRRAIGEGVEVETVFGGGLWNTFIDPAQVENAILNLAINARDAMDGQGKLTIELANARLDDAYARTHDEVTPGQYVMLAVSDTGSGMSPETMAKVFEPFFSTKAEGKGSGLGLSMVYGFVKQSGGHVKLYSEVGHGTTVRLYLPRALAAEDTEVSTDTGPVTGGNETVLVVEDDAEVRATVVELLGELGYRVLKAPDAGAALAIVESGIPIDVLFTDVVMPGTLKSPELARRARERLPDIAVLFTSGYTENSIVHGGRLDAGLELLSKPYTREALARKFRHVIANQRQRAAAGSMGREAASSVETLARPAGGVEPLARPAARDVEPGAAGPAARDVEPGAAGPAAVAGAAGAASLTQPSAARTVLLVEDDALIRASVADMLMDEGCAVIEAGSAEEALVALQTAPVDVLVTDVNLPGATGPELAARARDVRPDVVVVFATGDPGAIPADDGARVLCKPYSSADLCAAVTSSGRIEADGRAARV